MSVFTRKNKNIEVDVKHILTIAIPTFNRGEILKCSIERILPQIIKMKDYVSLLVSDNCSTDDTEQIVKKFIPEYGDILQYNRNETNLGAQGNFSTCVHLVKTKYIYLLGDDDVVPANFVSTIISILTMNGSIDILHMNYFVCHPRKRTLSSIYDYRKYNDILEIYSSSTQFISEFLDGPSFMSSIVFNRDVWIEGETIFPENCYGYQWLVKIYAGCKNKICAFYSLPILIQEYGEACAYADKCPLYFIVGKSRMFQYLDSIFHGVYKSWIAKQDKTVDTYINIISTAAYKKLYKNHKKEMLCYLTKWYQRLLFRCAITFFPGGKIMPRYVGPSLRRVDMICRTIKEIFR